MSATLTFLQGLCHHYLPAEPVELLVTGRGAGGLQSGNQAEVAWAGDAWVIRLDPGRRPEWLLDTLHEICHLRNGDVRKTPLSPLSEEEALAWYAKYLNEVIDEAARLRVEYELRAEEFARREAPKWQARWEEALRADGF